MSKKKIMITAAAVLVAASCAAPAHATPGAYTYGGTVRVTVAVYGGCATVTWPKGYTSSTCSTDQVWQGPITPGDRFGAAVVSASGGVSCRVVDVSTGDVVFAASARPGYVADCLRSATW
ncbi:hypothetical protein FK268_09345 [Tsukamurella sputi]|uniref:Uncharacterized protein n=1 Tax=Tsukamurella sputi TaxID=2591848 RepID=A0A5C5RTJ0_9ACTN|nr:hypothetical protein [Tsukamurella sputi]TWS25385.1 hypothetical protein FK268_09345 [Tsukamurella sputi]